MNVLFKLQVLGVFAARLPLVALAGLSLKHWKDALHSTDPGTARTTALVFQQCQLCLSLISATIPCLRSFIQSFDTGSGVKAGFGYSSNSGAYGHMSTVHHGSVQIRNEESYQMSAISRSKNCDSTLQREESHGRTVTAKKRSPHVRHGPVLDGDDVEMERRSTQESDRRSEQSTQELFIRKDVQWEVKREPARGKSAANQPGLLRLPK
ncbi:hypothetical protein N0V94_004114 [Neodidymelliopsis sp. IMI 364377]|nr:hypothetical protein N0V94_004114 [Neodidymelliopsis sp. IMI 364377]